MTSSFQTLPGLDPSITCRLLPVNDLDFFILEATPPSHSESTVKPRLILLLHGFPELAYSWRKVMAPLAAQGFAVVAPDLRGYGQTRERGNEVRQILFDDDLTPYQMINQVADMAALVYTLGYSSVEAVIGHDYGSLVAAHCALIRPDLFKRVVMMSTPYIGVASLETIANPGTQPPLQRLNLELASLDPPREYYMIYFASPNTNRDFMNSKGGISDFLRSYFRVKSANGNSTPLTPLTALTPDVHAILPHYYFMPQGATMPDVVGRLVEEMHGDPDPSTEWLPPSDLAVYARMYAQTGFQGGLNSYRCNAADPGRWARSLHAFVGKQIEVPAMFVAGAQDWGTYQIPGAAQIMRTRACKYMQEEDFVLIDDAGHWLQQEQPEALVEHLLRFVKK